MPTSLAKLGGWDFGALRSSKDISDPRELYKSGLILSVLKVSSSKGECGYELKHSEALTQTIATSNSLADRPESYHRPDRQSHPLLNLILTSVTPGQLERSFWYQECAFLLLRGHGGKVDAVRETRRCPSSCGSFGAHLCRTVAVDSRRLWQRIHFSSN
jgi:hypothetical protein